MEKIKCGLDRLKVLNSNVMFERIFVAFVAFITALFWSLGTIKVVPSYTVLIIIVALCAIMFLLFNHFKYFIPCVVAFMFANPEGYYSDKAPIAMLICGFSFVAVVMSFVIINRKKITYTGKGKSFYAFIYFAIFSFFPLIYNNLLDSTVSTLVWIYFSYLLYLWLFVLCLGLMDDTTWSVTRRTGEMIALICAIECIVKVLVMHFDDPSKNVLSLSYYLGWGLCNEAGILICFGIPFVYMSVKDYKKFYQYIWFVFKLSVILAGIFMTTSRGTYLFGAIELVILTIYTFIKQKHKSLFAGSIGLALIVMLTVLQIEVGIPNFIANIKQYVFYNGLDNNGRYELFFKACTLWQKNPLTVLFGCGWVAERAEVYTQFGMQSGYWVYHSTFFETLCCYGAIGVFAMIYHFYEKYKQLCKLNRFDMVILLVGYLIVDLYGMIDNTYNFYYYMIPLLIVMASLDAHKAEIVKEEVINDNLVLAK